MQSLGNAFQSLQAWVLAAILQASNHRLTGSDQLSKLLLFETQVCTQLTHLIAHLDSEGDMLARRLRRRSGVVRERCSRTDS